MTVYFAGGEPESYDEGPLEGVNVRTTAPNSSYNAYDPDFSRCGVAGFQRNTRPGVKLKNVGDGLTEGWGQSRLGFSSNSSLISYGWPVIEFADADDIVLFGIITKATGGGTFPSAMRYSTGASTSVEVNPQGNLRAATDMFSFVTMYFKLVAGVLDLAWYVNGIPIASVSGVSVPYLNGRKVKTVRWGGTNYADNITYTFWHSETLVTSVDPRGWRVSTLAPNSLGNYDAWNGNYADIDEPGAVVDADYISSDTAAQVESFGLSNLSVLAQNMDVKAVALASRGRRGAAGPQNVQGMLRTNSADVYSANLAGVVPTFSNLSGLIWQVNPVTGNPWTIAEIQNLEAGFKSIA